MHRGGDRRADRRGVTSNQAETFVIGGRRAVVEAIRSGRAHRVLVARETRGSEGLRSVLAHAEQAGIPVEAVAREALGRWGIVGDQGVVAEVDLPQELGERALSEDPRAADGLVVVLDGITDPQNFGACARSAEAAGAALLVARTRRAAPTSAAAVRASSGALLHLPVVRVPNLPRALERLKARGSFVVGLDHRADVSLQDAQAPGRPLTLVVGAEDVGLSRLVRESCDLLLSIPMHGRTESLNASAALAVALFGYALRPGPSAAPAAHAPRP
jgi:23S rRNA (guanosine2251-2'-O)-methyltransferase